jgi:hypothetical protein
MTIIDETLAALLLTVLTVFLLELRRRRQLRPSEWGREQAILAAAVLSLNFLSFFVVIALAVELGKGQFSSTAATEDPLQGTSNPHQWQERLAGYRAGYELARDPQHVGARRPSPVALNFMAGRRCQGRSADFQAGFKRGYVAGLLRGSGPAPEGATAAHSQTIRKPTSLLV